MKKPSLIGLIESTASTQLNRFVTGAKQQYDRLTGSAGKATAVQQKRYLRAAEKTIASAEKTIAQMKKKIAHAKTTLGLGKTAVKRKAKKKVSRKKRL
jgi:hypothetical protein